jgi:hypothetical protein
VVHVTVPQRMGGALGWEVGVGGPVARPTISTRIERSNASTPPAMTREQGAGSRDGEHTEEQGAGMVSTWKRRDQGW